MVAYGAYKLPARRCMSTIWTSEFTPEKVIGQEVGRLSDFPFWDGNKNSGALFFSVKIQGCLNFQNNHGKMWEKNME